MSEADSRIYHVTDQATLDGATDRQYRCTSLQQEGFIHCCKRGQLAGVLERYYQGVNGLVLLEIDPQLLNAKLVYENTVGGEELFPHIYGEINMSAVLTVEELA